MSNAVDQHSQGAAPQTGDQPAARGDQPAARGDTPAARGDTPAARVLIVDDNESTCRTLQLILRRKGFATRMAHSGADALAVAEQFPFDVALLDIKLPDVEGTELLRPLRGLRPEMAAIMLTANASVETAVRALNDGATAYIMKPFNMDEVLAVLRGCIDKQRLVRENRELYLEAERAHRELQEATAQLVHREKLVALGELTAGVAHELNQPLNSLKLICQSTLRYFDPEDAETMRGDLSEMLELIGQMAQIIDDMRIFSCRIDTVEKAAVDLTSVAQASLRFLEAQLRNHGIQVVKELCDDLPPVEGDPTRLQQVVMNLVGNARHAVEEAQREPMQVALKSYVRTEDDGARTVVLAIEDNGVGMAPELVQKVFLPFVTTREPGKGTGLGLSIANKIVQEHGGRIAVDSTPGQGTCMRLELPARQPELRPAPRGGGEPTVEGA